MRKLLLISIIAVLAVLSLGKAANADTWTPGTVEAPVVHVHSAPGNYDGDGSWAYSLDYGDYHPNGSHINAQTPSNDAKTLRNLHWGDVVIFDQQACCAYRIVQEDADIRPWTDVGEENTMIQVYGSDGLSVVASLIGQAIPYPTSQPTHVDFATHLRVFAESSTAPRGGSHAYLAGDHVLAKGPSRAAAKVSRLELGQELSLGGVAEGTYTVGDLYPGAPAGEGVVDLYAMTPHGVVSYRLVPKG